MMNSKSGSPVIGSVARFPKTRLPGLYTTTKACAVERMRMAGHAGAAI
jgi:hypothetical protein